jgi:membrane dipeptidase
MERGPGLLKALEAAGMIVDVTHLSDKSFWETLDIFGGALLASHSNTRALTPDPRQFDDEQIKALVARGAVIGASLDAWMIVPGWVRGETQPEAASLEDLANHVLHICELAGNAQHVGIGSDLDGGYGTEQTPHDLDTIADLQKLCDILADKGFSDDEVAGFAHGNWERFFTQHLPA